MKTYIKKTIEALKAVIERLEGIANMAEGKDAFLAYVHEVGRINTLCGVILSNIGKR